MPFEMETDWRVKWIEGTERRGGRIWIPYIHCQDLRNTGGEGRRVFGISWLSLVFRSVSRCWLWFWPVGTWWSWRKGLEENFKFVQLFGSLSHFRDAEKSDTLTSLLSPSLSHEITAVLKVHNSKAWRDIKKLSTTKMKTKSSSIQNWD